MNFITYFEPPYLLDYNYIVVPLPTGFIVSAYLNGEGVQEFLTTHIQFVNSIQLKKVDKITIHEIKYKVG